MIVAAAVDIREGRCVQLVGGDPEVERVSLPSPVAAARQWRRAGFTHLHVVDLDAALGSGSNGDSVREVVEIAGDVQVGGGVRSTEAVADLIEAGASRVIVGTRALADLDWLREVSVAFPGRVVAAADVRDGFVVIKGWTEASRHSLPSALGLWEELALGGVLVTDVSREGRLQGLDPEVVALARRSTRHPLWLAGGIGGIEDLRVAHRADADAVVLGMSLYTNAFDLQRVWSEFPQAPMPESAP